MNLKFLDHGKMGQRDAKKQGLGPLSQQQPSKHAKTADQHPRHPRRQRRPQQQQQQQQQHQQQQQQQHKAHPKLSYAQAQLPFTPATGRDPLLSSGLAKPPRFFAKNRPPPNLSMVKPTTFCMSSLANREILHSSWLVISWPYCVGYATRTISLDLTKWNAWSKREAVDM